jgi:DNA-binding transcriptional LysR family regulator
MNWDDVRLFLVCVETGSFRKAAERLGIDSGTMCRRIDRLEQRLHDRLFIRGVDGVTLTQFGHSLLVEAYGAERAMLSIERKSIASDARGVVRVAVSEGLGSYWIMPKLIAFQQANRFLTIDLRASMYEADVAKLDAEIAVQFHKPKNADLVVCRLGTLHTYPFVSTEYRDIFGTPRSISEALHHRIIQQTSPLLDDSAMARALGVDDVSGVVGIRTNSSSALLFAVESSAGIGVLPTFALALGAPLVPVDMDLAYSLDIWMIYHPDLKHSKRHVLVIDWIKRIFDPKRYPCFRKEFIHPEKLVEFMREFSGGSKKRSFIEARSFRRVDEEAHIVDPEST